MTKMKRGLSIALYGTGSTGGYTIEYAPKLGHKIVGVAGNSLSKIGKDAGVVCGRPKLGIAVSESIEKVLEGGGVDILVYTGLPGPAMVNAIDAATKAGVDFITAAYGEPKLALGADYARLEAQATKSGSRVLGTGVLPGLWFDVLPGLLATTLNEVKYISARRLTDPLYWGKVMLEHEVGVGGLPNAMPEDFRGYLEQSAELLAASMDVKLDRLEWVPGALIAEEDADVAGIPVAKGRVRGFDHVIYGIASGRRLIEIGWRGDPGCFARGERSGVEYKLDAGSEALSIEGFIAPPPNSYPATVARIMKSFGSLRSLPGGLYNPTHLPLSTL